MAASSQLPRNKNVLINLPVPFIILAISVIFSSGGGWFMIRSHASGITKNKTMVEKHQDSIVELKTEIKHIHNQNEEIKLDLNEQKKLLYKVLHKLNRQVGE